jgi:PEP-CTERM motif
MDHPISSRRLSKGWWLAGLGLAVSHALAVPVSMPTPQGDRVFDSASFASAFVAAPSGPFACFSAGSLSACTPASLQLSVLGPDLNTGLTLGPGAEVTLAVPAIGSVLAVWEAGDFDSVGDYADSFFSVHTAAGWSAEHSYAPEHIAHVINDPKPSGFLTNMGTFSDVDFGLAPGTVFDQVRIRSCCGANAHSDILAVAVVPEPGTSVLLMAGLLAFGAVARRKGSVQQRA